MKFLKSIMLALLLSAGVASAATIHVGPTYVNNTVRKGVAAASPGDSVVVDPGLYFHDVTSITKANLVLWCYGPGHATMDDTGGSIENNKGIFVVTTSGTGVVIGGPDDGSGGFEFLGARYPDSSAGNGAGVRVDGGNPGTVTITGNYFHDNQMNILACPSTLIVRRNHLDHTIATTVCDPTCRVGFEHDIYVNLNSCNSFTFEYNHSHRAADGNDVKSRAVHSFIRYNYIADDEGTASYTIDISDGGEAVIVGNVIEQGPNSANTRIISYAAESAGNGLLSLDVVNNTIVNDGSTGSFVSARSGTPAHLYNNIYFGPGNPTEATGASYTSSNNVQFTPTSANGPGFVDRTYEFHLTGTTPGSIIDAGTAPGTNSLGTSLTPVNEYVYNMKSQARPVSGALDLGAFEFNGGVAGGDVTPSAANSYFVPQAGTVGDAGEIEGQPAIVYAVTCPNNDLLSNNSRLKVVVKNAAGSPLAGISNADIYVWLNGGTPVQGFTGGGDDSIIANSTWNPLSQCPNLRYIYADSATDANGVTYITWAGSTPGARGTQTRDPLRKWGGYAGDMPVLALGVQLQGRITTGSANGTYTAHVKNVDSIGGRFRAMNQGEAVNALDYSPINVAQGCGGGAACYKYSLDFNNNGWNGTVDLDTVRQHMNHRCNYPNPN